MHHPIQGRRSMLAAAVVITLLALVATSDTLAQPCGDPATAGPHTVGFRSVTITRGSRSLTCRITYPAATAGQNATAKSAGAPWPIIAFGHGFSTQVSYYVSYYDHLASRGYIVIAPQFPDTQHGELALDLIACLDHLRSLNTASGSFLAGLVDTTRAGVTGHSMGGGASLLAAASDPRILVAAPLCAAETTPSAIARIAQIWGAVALVAGSLDGITPPAQHQTPMYNAAVAPRSLVMLQGAGHNRHLDVALFDFLEPSVTMSRATTQLLGRRFLSAAFDYYLRDDTCGYAWSYGTLATSDPRAVVTSDPLPMVPVELSHFSATTSDSEVHLAWRTEGERTNAGFAIERSGDGTVFTEIGFVPGSGTTTAPREYDFIDRPAAPRVWYRLQQRDTDGTRSYSPVLMVDVGMAGQPSLAVHPSPARGSVTLTARLTQPGEVSVRLIDMLGRTVRTLLAPRWVDAGVHGFPVMLDGVRPGAYVCELAGGGFRTLTTLVVY